LDDFVPSEYVLFFVEFGIWNLVQGVKRLGSSGKLFLMAREVGLGLSLLLASFSARSFPPFLIRKLTTSTVA